MIFLVLFFISFKLLADSSCSMYKHDCEYYTCISVVKNCNSLHYPLNFGRHYCLRFREEETNFSDEAQHFISEVRSCLIQEMETYEARIICSELWREAFKSHAPCYIEAGFCDLRIKDQRKILQAIWPSLRNVYVLASGINVLRKCPSKSVGFKF